MQATFSGADDGRKKSQSHRDKPSGNSSLSVHLPGWSHTTTMDRIEHLNRF